jgi:peptide/nickel transport system substrate-binding protein
MSRRIFFVLAVSAFIQFSLSIALSPPSLAQEWTVRGKQQGTLKVVDLFMPSKSVMFNYAESLIMVDKDNDWVPCLAEDWRWMNDRTLEFRLRKAVTFHNGEKFNAEVVRANWEAYKKMKSPRLNWFLLLSDETVFEILDDYTVRFTFPEPDALALVKLLHFPQIAPAFFEEHKFDENNYGYLPEAGPWGTGPFKLVEGGVPYGRPSDRVVLEAYEDYWERQFPKVKRVIFDNTLIGDRKKSMELCRETEGAVDIVSHIRPLDTLKVAESPFAKVVKSRDVTLLWGVFNQRKRDSKWRDIRLRKAVNYGINRKELWKYCAKGNAYNFGGFIPPGAYGHNPNLTLYTYDTTKARALLAEAGYPEGFEVKMITHEAWKLEAHIISKMLERIGLKVKLDVPAHPAFIRKYVIPLLDKPPEEQEWDIMIGASADWFCHTGASFLHFFVEESEWRWAEVDPVYDEMWKDMLRTVNTQAQEEKIRQMVQYAHNKANSPFIYSPLTLYAVNKKVNFVPQKFWFLNLKETSVTDKHWSVRAEKR